MSKRQAFAPGQAVEYCPVSTRDTNAVKWRPAEYVGEGGVGAKGWHRLRVDGFGTIEFVPGRRIRSIKP